MLYNVFYFTITLMLVIPMSISGVGSAILSFPIILISSFFYFIKKDPDFLSKEVVLSLFFYFIFVVFVTLVPFIHATDSFDLLVFVYYGLFLFVSSFMLVFCYRCHYKENYQYILLRNLYLVGSLNAVVAVLVILSPEIKDVVYSVIDTSKTNEENLTSGLRSSGLFLFGGSIMSLFHCLIVYIGLVYVKYKKLYMNNTVFIFDVILLAFNVLAVFLSGRMGGVILIITFVTILVTPSKFSRVNKIFVLKIILLVSSVLTSIILFFYNDFKKFIEWAFELFINIFSGNEVGTASSDVLKSMYRFPSDMIFGEGVFSMIGLGIDSGYVLMTWYFGIFAILVFLAMLCSHFFIVLQKHSNADVFAVYLFCLFLILIGNFKDIYLFGSSGVAQIYFISMILCLLNNGYLKLPRTLENKSNIF